MTDDRLKSMSDLMRLRDMPENTVLYLVLSESVPCDNRMALEMQKFHRRVMQILHELLRKPKAQRLVETVFYCLFGKLQ